MICSRVIENGLWSSMACHDHVSLPIKSNRCNRTADVWPHNLHSTMVTFSGDHLWWYTLERHTHTIISKHNRKNWFDIDLMCVHKIPEICSDSIARDNKIFTSAATRQFPVNSTISSSHSDVVICSFFQPPSGSSCLLCMWVSMTLIHDIWITRHVYRITRFVYRNYE